VIHSMTGFGSATAEVGGGRFTVTTRSVNHRYLEVSVALPRDLAPLEIRIKQIIQAELKRGRVEVQVRSQIEAGRGMRVIAAHPLIADLVSQLRRIGVAHALHGDVVLSDIVRFPGALQVVEDDSGLDDTAVTEVLGVVTSAVNALAQMRREEGHRLEPALLEILAAIADGARTIESLWASEAEARHAGLRERVDALVGELGFEDGRLYQEVVRLADRGDVAEEIQRLRSHVAQARERIVEGGSCGKPLDFLAQELNREANTIGSKSQSAAVTQSVVGLKSEIERFREQVQNVE